MRERLLDIKEKVQEFDPKTKTAVISAGVFAFAFAFVAVDTTVFAQIQVCGNMPSALSSRGRQLISFIIAAAILVGIFQTAKNVLTGDSEVNWIADSSSTLKGGVILPFALLIAQWGLSAFLSVDISCLVPLS